MAKNLGMDPELVEGIRASLKSQVGSLDTVADAFSRARLASLMPSNYGVPAGALVVAPQSIAAVTTVVARLNSARASAESLVGQLRGQIEQQITTSASDKAVSTPSVGKGSSKKGKVASDKPWWELPVGIFDTVDFIDGVREGILAGWIINWIRGNTEGLNGIKDLTYAAKYGAKYAPEDAGPNVAKFMGVLDNPLVRTAGKGLAVAGALIDVAVAAHTLLDPHSTAWDKTRDTGGAILGVAGAAVLIAGAITPVGWVVLGAGLAWTVTSFIVDHHVAIGKWISGATKKVGSVVGSTANAVASAGHAVDTTVSHAASSVVHSGEKFMGGIAHGLGI
jgi:hypothetical protein